MGILKSLQLRFFPPVRTDPVFGKLTFMFIGDHPERSYWECESWKFPPTNSRVGVTLPGDESGPAEEARTFYLKRSEHFQDHLNEARPKIEEAYQRFEDNNLPADLFKALKFSGFDIEDLAKAKPEWSMSFVTRKGKWLCIRVRFKGDSAFQAVVDT